MIRPNIEAIRNYQLLMITEAFSPELAYLPASRRNGCRQTIMIVLWRWPCRYCHDLSIRGGKSRSCRSPEIRIMPEARAGALQLKNVARATRARQAGCSPTHPTVAAARSSRSRDLQRRSLYRSILPVFSGPLRAKFIAGRTVPPSMIRYPRAAYRICFIYQFHHLP
jgi:hypothetical protein